MHDKNTSKDEILRRLALIQDLKIRRKQRRQLISLVVIVITVGLSWFGYVNYKMYTFNSNIPEYISRESEFTIYLPNSDLFTLVKESFAYSSGILTFKVTDDDTSYVVTEQSKPSNFRLSDYRSSQNISNTNEFDLKFGRALTGDVSNKATAIVVTDDTILNIMSDSNIDLSQITKLVQTLESVTN